MAGAPSQTLAEAIEHASTRLASAPAEAERAARAILARAPDDPRARLILASALRRQGRAAAARDLLEPLAAAFPRAALTHYELGQCLAAEGEDAAAIAALRHALGLQRALPEAWTALGRVLFRDGDSVGAEAAFAEAARAAPRNPALQPAAEALFAHDAVRAEGLLRNHLSREPDDNEALRLLAEALVRQTRYADAEVLLTAVLAPDPSHDSARFSLADVLFRQQKATEAIATLEPLLAADPRDAAYRNLMAASLALAGDYDRAVGLYQGLLADFPKQPHVWLNYGHVLRTLRRREDATAAYERCIALAPGLGEAYWALANLKTAAMTRELEAAMGAQLARADLPADDRLHLHYALGRALEDRGEAAAAFEHYAAGAALRGAQLRYDAAGTTAFMRRGKALYTPAFFAERAGSGSPSAEPIFIVGLPRSGSTLVEQILASHSAVEGTMELPDIAQIAARVGGGAAAYPEAVAGLGRDELRALGGEYLSRVRPHRHLGRSMFIDKTPNNFHHLGLIQLILPNARIIDVRRHPLGAGFSAFKQHFAYGHAFSYDLGDLGRYYRDYVEAMAHADSVLPGRVCRVIYEDLVEDTEAEVRRLLDYCGLAFEPACLAFYDNDRPVRTVSSEQVRRPIFREGLTQWRDYEPWLGPLKDGLGHALEDWRG